jgi:pimeloyl-ACP methyl ester carboxylesterase
MPYVPFKNGMIYYSDTGKGKALVLLHGFLESSRMWTDIVPKMGKSTRIIGVDLPGHGQSDCFGYVHSMELMAEAVWAVIQHLKLRKVAVLGHSMGGYVALAMAEQNPDKMSGLCLFFSTAFADNEERIQARNKSLELVKENHESFIRAAFPMLFLPKSIRMFKAQYKKALNQALRTPKQGIIAAIEGMKTRINREMILHFAPFKSCIVFSENDPVISKESIFAQCQNKDEILIISIEDCGHMGHIEALGHSVNAIKAFLKNIQDS